MDRILQDLQDTFSHAACPIEQISREDPRVCLQIPVSSKPPRVSAIANRIPPPICRNHANRVTSGVGPNLYFPQMVILPGGSSASWGRFKKVRREGGERREESE